MDIQQSIPEIYREVHHWVDNMSSQEELSQVCSPEYSGTIGVITRSKKKIKKTSSLSGQLVETKTHNLIRKFLLSNMTQKVGSIYTHYKPKITEMSITCEEFN